MYIFILKYFISDFHGIYLIGNGLFFLSFSTAAIQVCFMFLSFLSACIFLLKLCLGNKEIGTRGVNLWSFSIHTMMLLLWFLNVFYHLPLPSWLSSAKLLSIIPSINKCILIYTGISISTDRSTNIHSHLHLHFHPLNFE